MKKIVSFILAMVMAFTVIAVSPLTMTVNAVDRVDENSTGRGEKDPTISKNLKAGDEFFAGIDPKTGKLNSKLADDSFDLDDPKYRCVVKEDGTVTIEFFYWSPVEFLGAAAFLNPETLKAGKELIIPSKVNGYTVSEIVREWTGFADVGVKKIVIPETVQKIDTEAFRNNFFVEEIVFDGKSRLKEIGHGAFLDCRSLKSITIPASVEKLGKWAFANTDMSVDSALRKKDWHYVDGHLGGNFMTVSGIIYDAVETKYDKDDNLESYKINKPELIFDDVYSLSTVVFEKGSKLTHIGYGTFAFQKAITTVELPKNLETISVYAFHECPVNELILDAVTKTGITLVDTSEDDDSTSSENTEAKTDKKTETKSDNKTNTKPAAKPSPKNSIPAIKSAVSESAGTIELTWNDAGAASYIVYVAKSSTGRFTRYGTFTGTSATISGLESGAEYSIRVIRSDYTGELWEALGRYVPTNVTVK